MALLELKNVTKRFGGVCAVDHLSVGFEEGQISALIGPNGAGKTTAFNLIGGLLHPDLGDVTFRNRHLLGLNSWRIASLGIGRLFQDVRLFRKMTVLENIMTAFRFQKGESIWRTLLIPLTEFAPETKRKNEAMWLLENVGLEDKADALAENLSFGQQKLVAIARLLAADAKLLLLDEPTAGVNPVMIGQLLNTIKRLAAEGRTVIFVEHNMEVVRELAERVIFMVAGKMMTSGKSKEVLADPEVRAAYVGNHNGQHPNYAKVLKQTICCREMGELLMEGQTCFN
jgi:ABC-type branched-subunit amino acid transport system ATPase component